MNFAHKHWRLRRAIEHWRAGMPDDLLRAVLLEGDAADTAFQRVVPTLDPASVTHAQLLPLFHFIYAERLSGYPIEPNLQKRRLASLLRNKSLLTERNQILRIFDEANVPSIVFKGADLAFSVYPNAGCRSVGDVDLFVGHDRFADARDVLAKDGWHLSKAPKSPYTNAETWRHSGFTFSLDLHSHLNHHAVRPGLEAGVWARANRHEHGLRLSPEDAIVQVCCHGAMQNFHLPVRWAVDATLLMRENSGSIKWGRVIDISAQSGSGPMLALTLGYLSHVLGAEVPEEVIERLANEAPSRRFEAYWSYLLDRPSSLLERVDWVAKRFQHIFSGESGLRQLSNLPEFIRHDQKQDSTIRGLEQLVRKSLQGTNWP